MQDNINSADHDPTRASEEPDVIGKAAPWTRFGTGARATIMLGLTVGAVTMAAAVPFVISHSTSSP